MARAAEHRRRSVRGAGARTAVGAETLTEQAYRAASRSRSSRCGSSPGDVLSEQMLSATFKIGRTPIREALQRLAREGLVTILPRKGILVSDINPRSQLLVLEVRRELERLLSRAGAERATEEQREQLAGDRPTAWTRRQEPTTTSPSCGSTASSTR